MNGFTGALMKVMELTNGLDVWIAGSWGNQQRHEGCCSRHASDSQSGAKKGRRAFADFAPQIENHGGDRNVQHIFWSAR